jgi:phage N-6-adenine-methyltransferase
MGTTATGFVEIELEDREAALDWIDRCQLARRNLLPAAAQLIRGRLYNRRKNGWGGARRKSKPQAEVLKTSDLLAQEFGVSRATVERDAAFARGVDQLMRSVDPSLERRILSGESDISRAAVLEAARLARDDPDGARRRLKANGTSTDWDTPPEIVAAVLELFGKIDLDPCCSAVAGPTVPAERHFTPEDDGLKQEWHGKVYVNPPYGNEIGQWTDKCLHEWREGRVTEAVILAPARTDTGWMARLRSVPRLFIRGRLNFSGLRNPASFPSVLLYLGPRLDEFREVFSEFGDVYILAS